MQKLNDSEKRILREAEAIYQKLLAMEPGQVVSSPESVAKLFMSRLVGEEREHFDVAFLTQQHELIATERLFSGTINQASVHPREIAKRCLELNAAAVVLSHNHPSGCIAPSASDHAITKLIKETMALIEVRVLDHIIIGINGLWHSMAQAGDV